MPHRSTNSWRNHRRPFNLSLSIGCEGPAYIHIHRRRENRIKANLRKTQAWWWTLPHRMDFLRSIRNHPTHEGLGSPIGTDDACMDSFQGKRSRHDIWQWLSAGPPTNIPRGPWPPTHRPITKAAYAASLLASFDFMKSIVQAALAPFNKISEFRLKTRDVWDSIAQDLSRPPTFMVK